MGGRELRLRVPDVLCFRPDEHCAWPRGSFLLKLVPREEGHIVEISSRDCLTEKRAGIKYATVCLQVSMPVDLPSNFHSRHVSHKARATFAGRPNERTRDVVHAIE